MQSWPSHRDTLVNRFRALSTDSGVTISNPSGSVIVSHTRLKRFEGEGQASPYAVLGLCTGGGGATVKENDEVRLNDVWAPGRVGLALPGPAAKGFTPAMDMLVIAFDLNDVPACHGRQLLKEDLMAVQGQLFDDELASSVLIALLKDAEAHGSSSAFFDHGLSLVLHRLAMLREVGARAPVDEQQQKSPLASTLELIEARLDDDLRVKELAAAQGIEPRTFTRMFKRETGYTPYRYLTSRRMIRARALLSADMSVTETAVAVGYANPAKFAAAFRRWVGVPPSDWKR